MIFKLTTGVNQEGMTVAADRRGKIIDTKEATEARRNLITRDKCPRLAGKKDNK